MQLLNCLTSSNFHPLKFCFLPCTIFLEQSEFLQICLVNSGMCLSFNKSAKSDLQFRLFWPQAKESIYGEKFQSIVHNSKIPNIPIFPSKLLISCGISNQVNAPLIKEVCYAWFIFFWVASGITSCAFKIDGSMGCKVSKNKKSKQ